MSGKLEGRKAIIVGGGGGIGGAGDLKEEKWGVRRTESVESLEKGRNSK